MDFPSTEARRGGGAETRVHESAGAQNRAEGGGKDDEHLMLGLARPLLLFAALCVAAAATMGLLPESAGAAMADVPEAERVGTGDPRPASPGFTPADSPRLVPLESASAGGAAGAAAGGGVAPAGQMWRTAA